MSPVVNKRGLDYARSSHLDFSNNVLQTHSLAMLSVVFLVPLSFYRYIDDSDRNRFKEKNPFVYEN